MGADLHPIAGGERGQQIFAVAEVVTVKKNVWPAAMILTRLSGAVCWQAHCSTVTLKIGFACHSLSAGVARKFIRRQIIQRFFINGSMRTSALSLTM
ncbi:hypothetical protein M5585_26650 [Serratia ureilytica]